MRVCVCACEQKEQGESENIEEESRGQAVDDLTIDSAKEGGKKKKKNDMSARGTRDARGCIFSPRSENREKTGKKRKRGRRRRRRLLERHATQCSYE